jgi:hypothetical protein
MVAQEHQVHQVLQEQVVLVLVVLLLQIMLLQLTDLNPHKYLITQDTQQQVGLGLLLVELLIISLPGRYNIKIIYVVISK